MPRPPRAWQRFLSGRRINLLDPSPMDFEAEDLAISLSREPRWRGQTKGEFAYSVAQHCLDGHLLMPMLFRPEERTAQLALAWHLHDGDEGIIFGDQTTPTKMLLGEAYVRHAEMVQRCIHIRFGLPGQLPPALKKKVKRIDCAMAATEALQLAGYQESEIRKMSGLAIPSRPMPISLIPKPPSLAAREWLDKLRELLALHDAEARNY